MIKEVEFVIETAKQIMDDSMRTANEFDTNELDSVELQAEVIKTALAFQNMFDESYREAFEAMKNAQRIKELREKPVDEIEDLDNRKEQDMIAEVSYIIDRGPDDIKDEFYTSYIRGMDKTIVWHYRYAAETDELCRKILVSEIVHWQFGEPKDINIVEIANNTLEGKIRKEDL